MKYLLPLLLAGCVFGSTGPEGNSPNATESEAVAFSVLEFRTDPRVTDLLQSITFLSGQEYVDEQCQPNAGSCFLYLEGIVLYAPEMDGDHGTNALRHELTHAVQWYAERNIDSNHEVCQYWEWMNSRCE